MVIITPSIRPRSREHIDMNKLTLEIANTVDIKVISRLNRKDRISELGGIANAPLVILQPF
jgi:hypothetical protein